MWIVALNMEFCGDKEKKTLKRRKKPEKITNIKVLNGVLDRCHRSNHYRSESEFASNVLLYCDCRDKTKTNRTKTDAKLCTHTQ